MLACLLFPYPLWLHAADLSGPVGHTIEVLHDQQAEAIRLVGIDCPEKDQTFAKSGTLTRAVASPFSAISGDHSYTLAASLNVATVAPITGEYANARKAGPLAVNTPITMHDHLDHKPQALARRSYPNKGVPDAQCRSDVERGGKRRPRYAPKGPERLDFASCVTRFYLPFLPIPFTV